MESFDETDRFTKRLVEFLVKVLCPLYTMSCALRMRTNKFHPVALQEATRSRNRPSPFQRNDGPRNVADASRRAFRRAQNWDTTIYHGINSISDSDDDLAIREDAARDYRQAARVSMGRQDIRMRRMLLGQSDPMHADVQPGGLPRRPQSAALRPVQWAVALRRNVQERYGSVLVARCCGRQALVGLKYIYCVLYRLIKLSGVALLIDFEGAVVPQVATQISYTASNASID